MYKLIKAHTIQAGVHAHILTHTLHHTHTHIAAHSTASQINRAFEQGSQVLHGLTGPKCFKEAAERCSIWNGLFSAGINHSLWCSAHKATTLKAKLLQYTVQNMQSLLLGSPLIELIAHLNMKYANVCKKNFTAIHPIIIQIFQAGTKQWIN